MVIQVSPGVVTQEYDTVTSIPAVATTVGGFAGVFRWGPAFTPTLISTESQLVNTFGSPDANTYESFFTAANFLAYGNALYVVRAYDSQAQNAIANTGAATAPQLDNYNDFTNTTIGANIQYVAKYAGSLGNSLRISVCDSAAAYSSNLVANVASLTFTTGSNVATVNASSTVQGGGNVAANSVLGALSVGDYVQVGNGTIGYQFLKVSAIGAPVGAEVSANAVYYANGVTVSFASNYSLPTNITMSSNNTTRYWEFYNSVAKAPGTSLFMSGLGLTAQDEIHVVVVDTYGKFSNNPNQVLEVWPAMSRATDSKTSSGTTNFYKNILNYMSNYVYAITDRIGAATGVGSSLTNATTTNAYAGYFNQGVDSSSEGTISLGAIANGFALFASKEDISISLVLQGKANSVGGLSNYIISNIAQARMDCMAFVSPDSSIISSQSPYQYAVNFRNSTNSVAGINYNSSYAVMDGSYKYQYDKYNDVYRWVPLNGDIAGLCVATDYARDTWWSPAGFNRGQIKNVTKLLYNPNQAQRDLLYQNDINPIVTFPGQGTILYGDKTMIGKPSSFDRINVRRLFIALEAAISKAARSSLFEFNNAFTQAQFTNMVVPYLQQIQGRSGISAFTVICDSTNNTGAVIDANQFVGDIYIKPAKSINYIQLNFVAVGTGVAFNTIIGQYS